ncbi:MAG: SocA family protein [Candidatus Omnitrophica bacterium]|nr:SocA family protein [Candidatus Omnitrophota bacterium]
MNLRFDEKKTTQAAARLLKLGGGTMSYLKLIKLLYFVDREALARWSRPVTFDKYFSMPHGQVLSNTLDLIDEGVPPGQESQSYWLQHISVPENFDVKLKKQNPPADELSDAEVALIDEIHKQYGHLSKWDLRDLHHKLPEYVDPDGSCVRTEYRDILRAVGRTDAEIVSILADLNHLEAISTFLRK